MKYDLFFVLALSAVSQYAFAQGMNQQAGTAMVVQGVGAASNTAMGVWLESKCDSHSDNWACAMAPMAFMQAAQHVVQAAGSMQAKEASGSNIDDFRAQRYNPSPYNPQPYPNSPSPTPSGEFPGSGIPSSLAGSYRRAQIGLRSMAEKGYSVNPDGSVKTPNGNIPASTFASAAGLSSLGMTPEQIKELEEKAKLIDREAMNAAKVVPMGTESGGGGYQAGNLPGKAVSGFDSSKFLSQFAKKDDPVRSLAGMKKSIGNEFIGVSVDNIFNIIHRRFTEMRKQTDSFH